MRPQPRPARGLIALISLTLFVLGAFGGLSGAVGSPGTGAAPAASVLAAPGSSPAASALIRAATWTTSTRIGDRPSSGRTALGPQPRLSTAGPGTARPGTARPGLDLPFADLARGARPGSVGPTPLAIGAVTRAVPAVDPDLRRGRAPPAGGQPV